MKRWILIPYRPQVLLLAGELRERHAGKAAVVPKDRGNIGVTGDDVGVIGRIEVDRLLVAQDTVKRVRILGPIAPPKAAQVRCSAHWLSRLSSWVVTNGTQRLIE